MDTVVNGTLTHFKLINPQAKKDCLILHGWGQNGNLWLSVASQFSLGYRYFLLDLPGFGNTSHLPNNPSIPEYTTFVMSFIKDQKIKKPIIIGHSFGGQIAAYLAITHPKLLSTLILVSPALIRNKTIKDKIKISLYSHFSFLKKILPVSLIRFILSSVSSSDYASASSAHQQILKNIVNFHLDHQLSQLTTPTTIFWGDADTEIPYTGKLIAQRLPHAHLYVLYGADHNPHIHQPNLLAQSINHSLLCPF